MNELVEQTDNHSRLVDTSKHRQNQARSIHFGGKEELLQEPRKYKLQTEPLASDIGVVAKQQQNKLK